MKSGNNQISVLFKLSCVSNCLRGWNLLDSVSEALIYCLRQKANEPVAAVENKSVQQLQTFRKKVLRNFRPLETSF